MAKKKRPILEKVVSKNRQKTEKRSSFRKFYRNGPKNGLLPPRYDNDNLPFRLVLGIPGGDLGQTPPPMLFVQLGNLPGDAAFSFGPEVLGKLLERFDQSVRRLVENHGPGLLGEFFQARLTAFFLGQEALETEAVARQTGGDDGRNAGGRPGQRLDGNPLPGAGPGEQEAGVGNPGRAGIAHERDGKARLDPFADEFNRLMFIVFVVALQRPVNVEMLEQDGSRPCVFGEDQIRFLKHTDGPQRHIFEVSHRGGNDVEHSTHTIKQSNALF